MSSSTIASGAAKQASAASASSTRRPLPPSPVAFDWEKFRADGHKLIDYIADYHLNMCRNPASVPVLPNSKSSCNNKDGDAAASTKQQQQQQQQHRPIVPGFLCKNMDLIKHLDTVNDEIAKSTSMSSSPAGMSQDALLQQWQDLIAPGLVQWQHPHFYAYFPAIVSPTALLADLLSDSVMTPGFTWASCPSQTDLEQLVCNYLAEKAFKLHNPSCRFSWGKGGAGTIQPCATSSTITAMVAARNRALDKHRVVQRVASASAGGGATVTSPEEDGRNQAKLVVYYTDQAHFCVEKACKVLGVQHMRKIKTTFNEKLGNYPVAPEDLQRTIEEDVAKGLIPFFVSGNFGATSTVAVDPLLAVGQVAKQAGCWFHVDAAYAGGALLFDDIREKQFGGDATFALVDSICINGSKWMGLLMNASFLFTSDAAAFPRALSATGVYLTQNAGEVAQGSAELKDYQLGMGRSFRAYKVFAALQTVGIAGWRRVIERHMLLAEELDRRLRSDSRFEIATRTNFGLVVFRLRMVDPSLTLQLAEELNSTGKLYVITTSTGMGGAAVRVAFAHPQCDYEAVDMIFDMICEATDKLVPKRQLA